MKLKDKLEGLTCVVHRDVPATGVISYGQTHEPHCEACCNNWMVVMISAPLVLKTHVSLGDFRVWQANMARAA